MSKPLVKGCCPYTEKDAPPTVYAVSRVIEGDRGGWPKVITGALQRSLFIAPGLALAGIRGEKLLKGSLYGSAAVTGFLFVMYALRKKGILRMR